MGTILEAFTDRGFSESVNVEDELYAARDGNVYPITKWFGMDSEPCPKEEAATAVAGRCFIWFTLYLASFGIGPLAEVGTEEGDVCGRSGCGGVMIMESPMSWEERGCACHLYPPCGYCMSIVPHCPACDHFEPGPND